jgi:methanogenic corrinoid protein MtbC1
LLSATPGSTHTFGLTLLAEFFTRSGWDVQHEVATSWDNMRQYVGAQWFDMVGISVAKASDVDQLASAILSIRQVSMNSRLLVMVGGAAAGFVDNLAQASGADLTACDALSAVQLANRWVGVERLPA